MIEHILGILFKTSKVLFW